MLKVTNKYLFIGLVGLGLALIEALASSEPRIHTQHAPMYRGSVSFYTKAAPRPERVSRPHPCGNPQLTGGVKDRRLDQESMRLARNLRKTRDGTLPALDFRRRRMLCVPER